MQSRTTLVLRHRGPCLCSRRAGAGATRGAGGRTGQGGAQPRPMTFLDMQLMRQVAAPTPSPDGKWLLYTVAIPDWKEGTKPTDLFLVSMTQGVASTRQMTFTKAKNETSPAWLRDGKSFLFLSNRDAPDKPENEARRNQLYVMSPEGGEARRLTDAKEGVSNFAVSRDGRWVVYRAGKSGEEQLYRLPVDRADARPRQAPSTAISRPSRSRSSRRRRRLEVRARQHAHLLRHRERRRRGREAAAGEEVHRQHPQRGDAARQPVGARSQSAEDDGADAERRLQRQRLHDRR